MKEGSHDLLGSSKVRFVFFFFLPHLYRRGFHGHTTKICRRIKNLCSILSTPLTTALPLQPEVGFNMMRFQISRSAILILDSVQSWQQ